MAIDEHLSDTSTYRRLTADEAAVQEYNLRQKLYQWLKKHHKSLSKQERKFIRTSESQCKDAFPYFYLLMKVHKNPLRTRPIVSCSGSLLHALGVWIDIKFQTVAAKQKTYFKSSFDLKKELLQLHLPPGAKLFTADAVSMYTNIQTAPALREIAQYLRRHERDFPEVPINTLIDTLRLVMVNNIVHFGDTFWKQLSGCAMGTPPAPPMPRYSMQFGKRHSSVSSAQTCSYSAATSMTCLASGSPKTHETPPPGLHLPTGLMITMASTGRSPLAVTPSSF